jgi:hypothetical protein
MKSSIEHETPSVVSLCSTSSAVMSPELEPRSRVRSLLSCFAPRRSRIGLLGLLLASILGSSTTRAQIIKNGSFESPEVARNSYETGLAPSGWSYAGPAGAVVNGDPGAVWPLPIHGSQFVDIGNSSVYQLKQLFSIEKTGDYVLSWFDAAITPSARYTVAVLNSSAQQVASTSYDAYHSGTPRPVWQQRSLSMRLAAGQFTLAFTGGDNSSASDQLIDNVALTGPALQITGPLDVSVPFGEQARFGVRVETGAGDLTYQWYFNGTAIAGANSDELVIDGIRFSDEGDYWVAVSYPGGSPLESRHARLSITGFGVQIHAAVEIEIRSQTGWVYQVEGSTDLAVWTPVGAPITGTGQTVYRLLSTRELGYRFFRVRESRGTEN